MRRSGLQVPDVVRPLPGHAQEQGMADAPRPGQAAGARPSRHRSGGRGGCSASGLRRTLIRSADGAAANSPGAVAQRASQAVVQRRLLQGPPAGMADRGTRAAGATPLDQAAAVPEAEPRLHAQHRALDRSKVPVQLSRLTGTRDARRVSVRRDGALSRSSRTRPLCCCRTYALFPAADLL